MTARWVGSASRSTVLMEASDIKSLPQFSLIPRSDTVELKAYEPTKIIFRTHADIQELLFLSDTFDEGWTATVNGRPATIYKANFAFRGVLIPKGEATVVMLYQPKSFQTGLAISALAGILSVIYFIGLHFLTIKTKK